MYFPYLLTLSRYIWINGEWLNETCNHIYFWIIWIHFNLWYWEKKSWIIILRHIHGIIILNIMVKQTQCHKTTHTHFRTHYLRNQIVIIYIFVLYMLNTDCGRVPLHMETHEVALYLYTLDKKTSHITRQEYFR